MSSSSDRRILSLDIKVKEAKESLKLFEEAGQTTIPIREMLRLSMPRISDWQQRYERLATMMEGHQTCNYTEFSLWLGVSRQTVNNWKEAGYIIPAGNRVDLAGTYEFWAELKWLLKW